MKKIVATILTIVYVLGLVGCSSKKLTFDIGDASQIKIISGLTGDEAIITDEDTIKNITQNINSLTFEKTDKEALPGYAYMLTWMNEECIEFASIIITDENGYLYKVGADLAIDMKPIMKC